MQSNFNYVQLYANYVQFYASYVRLCMSYVQLYTSYVPVIHRNVYAWLLFAHKCLDECYGFPERLDAHERTCGELIL